MPGISLKEAIEVLKHITVCGKDERQVLSFAISHLQLLEQVEEKGIREEIIKRLRHETGFGIQNYGAIADEIIDLCNAHLVKKLEGIEEIIEQVLLNKIKIITDTEQTYSGYPAKLMRDLAQAIKTYLAKND